MHEMRSGGDEGGGRAVVVLREMNDMPCDEQWVSWGWSVVMRVASYVQVTSGCDVSCPP